MTRRCVSTSSWVATNNNNSNTNKNNSISLTWRCVVVLLGLVLLAPPAHALNQPCTYSSQTGGTCKYINTCSGAYGPSMSPTTTGCQSDPVSKNANDFFFFFFFRLLSIQFEMVESNRCTIALSPTHAPFTRIASASHVYHRTERLVSQPVRFNSIQINPNTIFHSP